MSKTFTRSGLAGVVAVAAMASASPALSAIPLPAACAPIKADRPMSKQEIKACFAALIELENFEGNGSLVVTESGASRATPGPKGQSGTGIAGEAGADGPRGATGAQGSQGIPGATGNDGPQGGVGPQGAAGEQGPTGETGPWVPSGDS